MLWLTGATSTGKELRFGIDCLAVPQEFITKFLIKFKNDHPKDDIKAHNVLAKEWLILRKEGILQLDDLKRIGKRYSKFSYTIAERAKRYQEQNESQDKYSDHSEEIALFEKSSPSKKSSQNIQMAGNPDSDPKEKDINLSDEVLEKLADKLLDKINGKLTDTLGSKTTTTAGTSAQPVTAPTSDNNKNGGSFNLENELIAISRKTAEQFSLIHPWAPYTAH